MCFVCFLCCIELDSLKSVCQLVCCRCCFSFFCCFVIWMQTNKKDNHKMKIQFQLQQFNFTSRKLSQVRKKSDERLRSVKWNTHTHNEQKLTKMNRIEKKQKKKQKWSWSPTQEINTYKSRCVWIIAKLKVQITVCAKFELLRDVRRSTFFTLCT